MIGEIGCSWPLDPSEEVVLRAAARAQRTTGAPMIVHPLSPPIGAGVAGRNRHRFRWGPGHLTVIAHMDRTDVSDQDLARLVSLGFFVAYESFGSRCR